MGFGNRSTADGFGGPAGERPREGGDAPYGPRALGATTDPVADGGWLPAPVQAKGADADPETIRTAAAHGVADGGGGLPHGETIQRAFGHHDVGGVVAHTGARATEASREMGAAGYAVGDHVAFAGTPDLHTAAHEAAHVVQQRAGVHLKGDVGAAGDEYERHADRVADLVVGGHSAEAELDRHAGAGAGGGAGRGGGGAGGAVQRKIVIAGKDYDPTPDYEVVDYTHGAVALEALQALHNGGKDPVHEYESKDRLMQELSLRDNATKGMAAANANGDNLRYATRPGDPRDGHLDPAFWVKKGFYQFVLKPGAKPAAAVRSIFEGKDNVLECNSTMVAIEYKSMLDTMGDDDFNQRFSDPTDLVISPHHTPPKGIKKHPFHAQEMIEEVLIESSKDLIPGDWVYFKNFPDYGQKHPGGFWTGEHTMYLGEGKFQGFGTEVSSEEKIRQKLLDNYNDGLPESEQKKLEDVPGLQNYARRPKSDKIID